MSEHDDLIAELRALGAGHLAVPDPADQRAAVRARLAAGRPRRWRWLVAAVAAAAVTVGAVEPARAGVVAAVGGLLRVAGIEVRGDSGPVVPPSPSPLPSTGSVTLDQARRVAAFPIRLPATLGPPEQVQIADPDAHGAPRVVTLVYRGATLRLDQFDGTLSLVYVKQARDAQWVEMGGEAAIWLPTPHPVEYVARDGSERTAAARLAGPTLIWQHGLVTYRLEGLPTKEEAAATARSLR